MASPESSPDPGPAAEAPRPLWLRAKKSLGKLRRRFNVDTYDVFLRPVLAEDAEFEAPAGYTVRWGTAEDIEGCEAYHTELDERERTEGAARLGFGHRVVAILDAETVVFTMWVNPRHLNIPGEIKRKLGSHQWFIYKAFTSPDHRGKKLYKAGMRFVLAEMARAGLTELVGYAHVKKGVSRKGLARLDFGSAGRYQAVSIPGWKRVRVGRKLAEQFPAVVRRSGIHSS